MQETWVQSLGWEDPLQKERAAHSSILAWEIPWTEEPGRLQARGRKDSDPTEWLTFSLFTGGVQEAFGPGWFPCSWAETCLLWLMVQTITPHLVWAPAAAVSNPLVVLSQPRVPHRPPTPCPDPACAHWCSADTAGRPCRPPELSVCLSPLQHSALWAPLRRRPVPSLPLVLEILQLALVHTAEGAPSSFSVVLHGVVPSVLKAVVC